jgi:enhancing lycopene biosynthesis protein 2
MKKRVGVLLAGCGVYDGSEIHEATLTLLFLDRENAESVCIAPEDNQVHTINHQTGDEMDQSRNIFVEAARISRGSIIPLAGIKAADLDALILPGGFGAAKNLINYAFKGRECTIRPDVKELILSMVNAGKPVGAICIAPVVLAVALKDEAATPLLTIGNDGGTASDIVHFGAEHQKAAVDEIVIDEKNRIVTTPAYMLGPTISHVAKGIEKLVKQIMVWI